MLKLLKDWRITGINYIYIHFRWHTLYLSIQGVINMRQTGFNVLRMLFCPSKRLSVTYIWLFQTSVYTSLWNSYVKLVCEWPQHINRLSTVVGVWRENKLGKSWGGAKVAFWNHRLCTGYNNWQSRYRRMTPSPFWTTWRVRPLKGLRLSG